MTPPINIGGDTVDAATIGGDSVKEVTVGGDVVFGDPIPDKVDARWQLNDDSTASTAVDSIGGRDGSISSSTYTTAAREGSYALDVSGGGEVSFGNITDSESKVGTIGCWVNASSLDSDTIFDTNGYRFAIGYERNSNGGYEGRAYDGYNSYVITSGTSTTGSFVHLALTWDGSTLEFYVDGNSQGTASVGSIEITTDNDVLGNSSGSKGGLEGIVDDGFWSTQALTQSEIQEMIDAA